MKTGLTRCGAHLATATLGSRLAVAVLLMSLAGCFDDDPSDAQLEAPTTPTDGGTTGGAPTTPTANRAPTISGTPVTTAKVALPYTYQPTARDADGDRLTFEINGKPSWATFSASTGRLTGIPPAGSTGTFTGVQITVSDGQSSTATRPFNIDVVEPAVGSAELVWQSPTMNEDGTALSDLSGYVIRYGRDYGALDQSIRIENPGVTTYVLDNLTEGTWYFSLAAVNAAGVESRPTGYVSRTIS
jgi:hypothetical protein